MREAVGCGLGIIVDCRAFILYVAVVLQFCAQYKTCDMGTDRHVARARDVLLDFCSAICVALFAGARPRQIMMPPALEICDWNHLIDAVMRWALSSLPDFIRALTDIIRSRRERLADILCVFYCRASVPRRR